MATNLTVKTKPIILKYSKQGMPGRTGPVGEPGKDATNWTVAVTMEGIPSGTCRVRLYKDGVLNADETHYAAIYVMQTHRTSFALSAAYSHNIIGTYTFQYTDVRAVFVVIYDDSFMEDVLTAQMAQMIRGRDLKLLNGPALSFTAAQWSAKGAAGTVNTWTTGSDYDNSTLEDGDLVCIIGTVSDQLDGSGNPIACMIIGQAQIAEGETAEASVSVISRALFVGQQGAKGDKGDRGEPGKSGTSVPWGAITGSLSDQDDLVAALAGKVSKTGDTMTGALILENTAMRIKYPQLDKTTAPTSDSAFLPIHSLDVNNLMFGGLQFFYNKNRSHGWRIVEKNQANNEYINIFGAYINPDDSRGYEVNDPAAFRNAIGASGGIFPISLGGTGAKTAAAARANLEAAAEDHTHTAAAVGAVAKTGDTMTGALALKGTLLQFVDNNSDSLGGILQNLTSKRIYARAVNTDTKYHIDAYLPIPDASETAHSTKCIPFMTAGTSDLTAGTSALTTNCIRLVYE